MARYDGGFRPAGRRRGEVPDPDRPPEPRRVYGSGGAYAMGGVYGLDPWQESQINPSVRRGRRRRPIAGRWRWSGNVPGTGRRYGWEYRGGPPTRPSYPEPGARWVEPGARVRRARGPRRWSRRARWRAPEEWWHAVGPEPRADYDWHYSAGRPERYGWSGETGRD